MVINREGDKMRKSSKRKNQKNRGLFLTVLAILIVGIGFAALQKYLTIDGTASINSSFDVRFTNISTGDIVGGAYNKTEPSVTNTTATFDAAFLAPGDSISYNINIENAGTINAKLDNVDVNIEENENISYELIGITAGDIIESYPYSEIKGDGPNATEKLVVLKLTYTGMTSEITTSNVKVTMKFIQTNEQTNNQTSAISLIESEKPVVSYDFIGLKEGTNSYGQKQAEISMDWNSENEEQLLTYFLGTEVYKKYQGDNWKIVKNATDDIFVTENYDYFKLRNVYAINGVKYYSMYSDEFSIKFEVQDGFLYKSNDSSIILATDDSYFTNGIVTLPSGKKFKKLTSNNVTKVIIPEEYILEDLLDNSLPTKKIYGTSLETIVNKTGESIDWAPIIGFHASSSEGKITCEFVSGTCADVEIIESE